MSRSGYWDDCDDQWLHIRWRGQVASATRGKRGQAFLRGILEAMDAMPEKKLYPEVLVVDDLGDTFIESFVGDAVIIEAKEPLGAVCAMGAYAKAKGIDTSNLDPEDPEGVADAFKVAEPLVREIAYTNDEGGNGRKVPIPNVRQGEWDSWGYKWLPESPEERFTRMHKWIKSLIKEDAA